MNPEVFRARVEGHSTAEAESRADLWPEPGTLPSVSETVPPMPAELLSEPLRGWIVDAAERIGVPIEYVGLPSVVSVGALVGRSVSIRPKRRDDWSLVPTLWGASIGGPGALKSPAIAAATRHLRKLAARARRKFEEQRRAARGDMAERKARIDAAKRAIAAAINAKNAPRDREVAAALGIELDEGPLNREQEAALRAGKLEAAKKDLAELEKTAEPVERRYVTNDATTEKLGELLIQSPRGLLILRDELTGWLHTMEKPGREGDRAFFLEAWEGIGGFDVDRIGRGSIHVPALTLSVYGGIQPDRLAEFFSGAMAAGGEADGLLQRHQLLAWPDDLGEWRNVDRFPDSEAGEHAFRVFERLDTLDATGAYRAKAETDEIPFLRFALDAQELFDEWLTLLMRRVRCEEMQRSPGFAAHLSKFPSLMPKLALLFHLVAVADGSREAGPVPLESARLAAAWCDFLESHARKVYAPELRSGVAAAHRLAEKIRAGAITDRTSVRDVYRREWSGLRTSAAVYAGLDLLAEHGWLRLEAETTGGADRTLIRLNPGIGEAT